MYMYLCFRGAGPGCNTREISDKLVNVQDELEELNRQEAELDQLKLRIQQSIKNVNDEVSNSQYPYNKAFKQGLSTIHVLVFIFLLVLKF